MSTKIIIDSAIDIPSARTDILTVPITIRFGETEYLDGVTLSKTEFYEKLVETDTLPATCQINPLIFEKIFRSIEEQGDSAVVITVSSELSGTWQSACLAAADFSHIHVIDSRLASIGGGVLALHAANCVQKGMRAEEIASEINTLKSRVKVVALLNTLEFLKKGGRISGAAAIAGGLLNIKPVLTMKDGLLIPIGKARGSKAANNLVAEIVHKNGVDTSMPVLFAYSGLSDHLLRKYMEDNSHLWKCAEQMAEITQLSAAVGVYAGPGAIVAAYFSPEVRESPKSDDQF